MWDYMEKTFTTLSENDNQKSVNNKKNNKILQRQFNN